MTITRLNHVQITIPQGTEDEGRAFYCGVLGLPEIEKPDSLKGRGGFWVRLGDVQLHVGVEDGFDRLTTKAHVAYEVTDLAVWRERLDTHGIRTEESVPIPGFDRFEARDPFGNRIEFIQPLGTSDILTEQIAYYRARAHEYDEWFYRVGRYDYGEALNQRWFDEVHQVMAALHAVGPVGDVLEMACGTGIWTEQLLGISQRVTALDASPEMLAINRDRLKAPNVTYHQVDLFDWEPQAQYDMVFFGFWLSHVPPERLDGFLDKAYRAVRPAGRLFLVDSRPAPTSSAHDHQPYEPETNTHVRRLNDGSSYTIIKVFYDPSWLRARLMSVGFDVQARTTDTYFLYASGTRPFLEQPSLAYKASFIEAVREFQPEGRYLEHEPDWLAQDRNFEAMVQRLTSMRTSPPPGWVPASELWLISDGVYIGRASIRHELNDSLRQFGGHIGYEIRPSRRRQGYGKLICRLALDHARRLGIRRALITCDETNTGSRRIIEANGGRFEKAVLVEGRPVRTLHFWVDLA